MPQRTLIVVSLFAALSAWSPDARGSGGAASDAYDGIRADAPIDVHGLIDAYVQTSLVAATRAPPPYRAFDDRERVPSLGVARLTLARAPGPFGFRLDVGAGDLANAFLDLDPASRSDPDVARGLSYVEQAFVTAVAPIGRGLAIDLGKFGTPVGFEDNESLASWHYSRSLLFTLGEPTYHTGARITARASDALDVSAFWLNGWNTNLAAGNGMRSFGAAATWNATERLQLVAVYLGGPERAPMRLADPALALRHEIDGYARWEASERIALAWTIDYGHDAAGGGVAWWGIGGSLRWRALPWLAGAIRAEHYDDGDGFTSGTRQRLAEATFTIETRHALAPFTVVARLEYRRDQSDARVFPGDATHQDTLTLGVLVAF